MTDPIADPRAIAAAEKEFPSTWAGVGGKTVGNTFFARDQKAFLKGWQARDAAGPATREQGSGGVGFTAPPNAEYTPTAQEVEAAELIAKLHDAVAFTKAREHIPMIEEFKIIALDGISYARRHSKRGGSK